MRSSLILKLSTSQNKRHWQQKFASPFEEEDDENINFENGRLFLVNRFLNIAARELDLEPQKTMKLESNSQIGHYLRITKKVYCIAQSV